MTVTKKITARKIADYLHHAISLQQLVDWAENAMLEGGFDENDAGTIAEVVARLGVADVRTFGLSWYDCEELLQKLGFSAKVDVVGV